MQVVLSSPKYPGITLNCPQVPGGEGAGSYYFAVDRSYQVTAATLESIKAQFAGFPAMIRDEFRLAEVRLETETVAVEVEVSPAVTLTEDIELEVEEELTEEDLDLISVEVSKLLGQTVAQAKPQIISTASNAALPRNLRLQYLEEVATHPELQKTLKDTAQDMLSKI